MIFSGLNLVSDWQGKFGIWLFLSSSWAGRVSKWSVCCCAVLIELINTTLEIRTTLLCTWYSAHRDPSPLEVRLW